MNSPARPLVGSVQDMSSARIVAVSIGPDRAAPWAGKMNRTAIDKRPVHSAVQVGVLGLAGDQQSDKLNHGGPDQAVYVYAREDLDWWAQRLGRELRDGMFGENVTTAGLDVNGAMIGEIWQFGGVVVQVTSPRIPCVVFRNWMDEQGWIKTFRASRRPGPYLRVLRPGMMRAGDPIEVLDRPAGGVTVAEAMEAFYERDLGVLARILATPGHSAKYQLIAADWHAAGQEAAAQPAGPQQAESQQAGVR